MRIAVLACLLAACGGGGSSSVDAPAGVDADSVDAPPSASCVEAETHSDLTWIQENIFAKQCVFSGCHNGGTGDAGRMDLRPGHAHASLVGSDADLCPGTLIVSAGHPEQSYIEVMIGDVQPAEQSPPECTVDPDVGLMPQANPVTLLCTEKRAAIKRWIEAGALDN